MKFTSYFIESRRHIFLPDFGKLEPAVKESSVIQIFEY